MRKVMMVVPVFMTSCQVSLNSNIGPVTAQAKIMITALAKVAGCPVACEVHLAKRVDRESCT
jgi:hypothetical protein